MTFPRASEPSPALAETVTERIWPNVLLQWEGMGGLPPMRRAAVIGAGSWGTAVAVLLARGGLEVAARHPHRRAGGRARRGAREPPLPRGRRAARLDPRPAGVGDRARRARPRLPRDPLRLAAAGGRRDRRPGQRPLLGAAPDQGPDRAAGQAPRRVRRRARPRPRRSPASAARPTPARPSPAPPRWCSAPPTPTCATSSARSSTAPASSASARATSSASRWRAPPRTPPCSPPRRPSRYGLNAAGIAAAEVWRECIDYAVALGAELETFTGLAGVGDLTATLIAPEGRNRRAGELLGARHAGGRRSRPRSARPPRGSTRCRCSPTAIAAAGSPAEALAGLAALIGGEIDGEDWVAGLRRVERRAGRGAPYRCGARLRR